MTSNPTPGADSELQALYCPFCAGLAQVEQLPESDKIRPLWWLCGCADADCLGMSHTPFERRSDAIRAWNRRATPPAPVQVKPADGGSASDSTKESSREAVAEDERITAWYAVAEVLSEVCPGWLDGPENGMKCAVAAIRRLAATPPPDRVQPERVEAKSKHKMTIARLRGITKHLRECPAYANLQGDADWIDEAADFIQNMLVEQYTASAPPTDASGVVTDANEIDLVLAELDDGAETRADSAVFFMAGNVIRKLVREAADRARKQTPVATQPTDASAQAASAEEPVAWVDGADIGFLRDRGQRLTALSMTQDLPCMVPLYAAPTPVADYREVTIDDIDVLNLAVDKWMTTEVGFTCDDKNFSLKEAHFRRRMFAALRSIGAVIRTTDAPTYRPCTFADAERIKASADGAPPLESETNDMLAALNKHGAVIRTDGQQAQPE